MRKIYTFCLLALLFMLSVTVYGQEGKTWQSEEAWNAIPGFQYGDDPGPLLFVEREVENAASHPEKAREKAAKIASLLNEKTGRTGRQFLCFLLRWVGTEHEVPVLERLLNSPEDCDDACAALEMIPGEKALNALRQSLDKLQGRTLSGVMNSLAKRNDSKSIPKLRELAKSSDKETARTAQWAIETIEKRWPVNPTRTFPVRKIPESLDADQALKALNGDDYLLKRLAVQSLGRTRKANAIKPLVELLRKGTNDDMKHIILDAMDMLPPKDVAIAMIAELDSPVTRSFAVKMLIRLEESSAFAYFLKMSASDEKEISTLGLSGLAGVGTTQYRDISPLLKTYLQSSSSKYRESLAGVVNVICSKSPDKNGAMHVVFETMKRDYGKTTNELLVNILPLLGKLGGPEVKATIDQSLASNDHQLQTVALRALCNWPDELYKDDLWKIASGDMSPEFKSMAVRAYIRVITLKSNRPAKETLRMLQNAMKVAQKTEDKNWCLHRAHTVRTFEAVNWIASWLDDPELAQTACKSLVELAHHRFLRQPHKARFDEILTKVEQITTSKKVADDARKAKLGM